ncbi:putative amp dependent CoA ligase [Lasiosphaeris hirsuta]|uniref:Amp dependent CoA ligase n=1 Tax=Lasiosphaeris hirsuta TaxID=260670 RepID=A0AA40E4E6_9PEZI|nr:putative amp dependent CoA ligase [Lasiosphaeris hirsuta]
MGQAKSRAKPVASPVASFADLAGPSVTGDPNAATFKAPASPPLPELNIGQLLDEQAVKYPDSTAIVSRWQEKRVTYRELHDTCRHLARSLLHHGVRPGDHVIVLAGNTIEYAEMFFAVGAVGAIFSIINPTFTTAEVVSAVDLLDPVAIFVADRIGYRKNDALLAELTQARAGTSLFVQLPGAAPSTVGNAAGALSWDEFRQKGTSDAKDQDDGLLAQYWAKSSPDDTTCVQFTSGTTGPRKAAMITHRNLMGNAWLSGYRQGYTSDDIVCCCTPLFHCFALVCGIMAPLLYGAAAVVPSDVFLAGATIEALDEEKCTIIHGVATMFQALLDHPEAGKHAPSFRLRTGIVAGSALSHTWIQRLADEFRFTGLAYGYGMTELSCMVFLTDHTRVSLLDDHSSVGALLPHSAARVVDSDLRILPPGVPGELLVAGYLVFKGYYKNPAKTEEALIKDPQGRSWLRTGDLVSIDAAGSCIIRGRVKDMIKRGGENIFPADVESVLEQHPDVAVAAVVGIPDDYWGEIVGVFVQRATKAEGTKTNLDAKKIGDKDLKLFLRNKIASHKTPEHYFWLGEGAGVPDELPFNHTGKLMKQELRLVAITLVEQKECP